ncbi:hypothetical protein EEL33_03715 [Muribaculaceae bacterium Isolate-037 (Harlan)]|nr:hypothetical protein EEL33_03715 [Muribaculaceae bacterium Isolate-037 (Harlan)]
MITFEGICKDTIKTAISDNIYKLQVKLKYVIKQFSTASLQHIYHFSTTYLQVIDNCGKIIDIIK